MTDPIATMPQISGGPDAAAGRGPGAGTIPALSARDGDAGTETISEGEARLSDDPLAEAEAMIAEMTIGLRGEGRFEVTLDKEINRFIYRAVDETTGEVIKQFPPEAILRAVRAIRAFEGLILDEEA